jgi:tRNA threonylcarbamoyladenosine biosynthesis protein TsaB
MANILALDTSTDACSVALQKGESVYAKFEVVPRQHTQRLLPMVEELLTDASIKVSDLDVITFGRGPGSFAGIRIAAGAAQGLAVAFETPMAPVSTLETLAYQALAVAPDSPFVLATLDARMDEIYSALYAVENGTLVALTDEIVCAPSALELPESVSGCFAVGGGMNYFNDLNKTVQGQIAKQDASLYPDAKQMLSLASQKLEQNLTVAPEEALPVYVREGSWKKRSEQ